MLHVYGQRVNVQVWTVPAYFLNLQMGLSKSINPSCGHISLFTIKG